MSDSSDIGRNSRQAMRLGVILAAVLAVVAFTLFSQTRGDTAPSFVAVVEGEDLAVLPETEKVVQSRETPGDVSWDLVTYDSSVGICLDLYYDGPDGDGMVGGCGATVDRFPESSIIGWVDTNGDGAAQVVMIGMVAENQGITSISIEMREGTAVTTEVVNLTWFMFDIVGTPVSRVAYDAAGNEVARDDSVAAMFAQGVAARPVVSRRQDGD